MKIIDANIVLRYLLNDHEELSTQAAMIIENEHVFIPNEIIAEIVYVLEKVYGVSYEEIASTFLALLHNDNIGTEDFSVLESAFELFSSKRLDFVDTLLYAQAVVNKHEIYTFDKNPSLSLSRRKIRRKSLILLTFI